MSGISSPDAENKTRSSNGADHEMFLRNVKNLKKQSYCIQIKICGLTINFYKNNIFT
jgi:hypothetical protein